MYDKVLDNEAIGIISKFKKRNNIKTAAKDLTHLKTYSIDDPETCEIDDAISLEKVAYQDKLWIHIASPSSYFDYQSASSAL